MVVQSIIIKFIVTKPQIKENEVQNYTNESKSIQPPNHRTVRVGNRSRSRRRLQRQIRRITRPIMLTFRRVTHTHRRTHPNGTTRHHRRRGPPPQRTHSTNQSQSRHTSHQSRPTRRRNLTTIAIRPTLHHISIAKQSNRRPPITHNPTFRHHHPSPTTRRMPRTNTHSQSHHSHGSHKRRQRHPNPTRVTHRKRSRLKQSQQGSILTGRRRGSTKVTPTFSRHRGPIRRSRTSHVAHP